jgi:thiopeptide-type bacteriocin biosynthesis protein
MDSQPPVTQPVVTAPDERAVARVGDARWVSYHLFHSGDREALLTEVVRPVVSDLWSGGAIDGFFFIRYEEGGKHLRLRLRVAPGIETEAATGQTRSLLEARSARFREALDAPESPLLPIDIVRASFELEEERYGGPRFFPCSLAFFALSSVDAIDFVERWRSVARARQLTEILTRLTRQAVGLARTAKELRDLGDYFVQWRSRMAAIVARGDQMFENRRDDFVHRVREVLAMAMVAPARAGEAAPGSPEAQVAHARCLAAALDGLEGEARWRATTSQMHMTANRLGLNNAEESYLSAILCRSIDALGPELDALVAGTSAALADRPAGWHEASPAERLDAVVAAAMQAFFTRDDRGASGDHPEPRIDPSNSRAGEA